MLVKIPVYVLRNFLSLRLKRGVNSKFLVVITVDSFNANRNISILNVFNENCVLMFQNIA